jgi:thymidylate kinase
MNKVAIIEGVSTSGKTSIIYNLQRYAEEHNLNWIFVTEEKTTLPIIDSLDLEFNNSYLLKVISQTFDKKADLYVFDRLYLSSLFKIPGTIKDLFKIEDMLIKQDSKLFLLHVSDNVLKERILESMAYRRKEWTQYVVAKENGDKNKVAEKYIEKQKRLKELFLGSKLEKYLIDTGDQNFVKNTRTIIDILNLKPTF